VTPQARAALEALVAKWRIEADFDATIRRTAIWNRCADDLEALMSAATAGAMGAGQTAPLRVCDTELGAAVAAESAPTSGVEGSERGDSRDTAGYHATQQKAQR
jgi:hypothetical protein